MSLSAPAAACGVRAPSVCGLRRDSGAPPAAEAASGGAQASSTRSLLSQRGPCGLNERVCVCVCLCRLVMSGATSNRCGTGLERTCSNVAGSAAPSSVRTATPPARDGAAGGAVGAQHTALGHSSSISSATSGSRALSLPEALSDASRSASSRRRKRRPACCCDGNGRAHQQGWGYVACCSRWLGQRLVWGAH